MDQFSLCDGKTNSSSLTKRAAGAEELAIAKNGAPTAKLVPFPHRTQPRRPANAMGITFIADDFGATDAQTSALFNGRP